MFQSCWLPIQRRVSGSVSFDRTWSEYEEGFGDYNENFWLGETRELYDFCRWDVVRVDCESEVGEFVFQDWVRCTS